jgi:hypothetical protein
MHKVKKLRSLSLVSGLATLLLITVLLGLGSAPAAADPLTQSQIIGLNGAPCAYNHIAVAITDAEDGDTVYVDVSQVYTGTGIGLIQKDVTVAAATDNCQTPTSTLAIVDGGGRRLSSGGMMTVDDSRTVRLAHVRLQNAQADRGGIVDIDDNGTLILEASGIASGTAGTAGGGVYVGVGGALIMREGSVVFANAVTETTSRGGGIYAISGTITMTNSYVGVPISGQGNAATDRGGGVFLDRSSLYLNSSMILANDAVEGGGVYAQNDSVVETVGNSIIGDSLSYFLGNYADDGAGVYLDRDSVLVMYDDSQVSFNAATDFGGGVYAGRGSIVTMEDAGTEIYSNTATFGGGAVISGTGASLYMAPGAQVVDNRAAGSAASGGGIYATNGALVSGEGVGIVRNHADLVGGGIYVRENLGSIFTRLLLDGASLENNSALYGGGLYVSTGNTRVTLNGAWISGNYALETGGGIRVFGDSKVNLYDGSVISGNVAGGVDGGGLAIRDGQVLIADSQINHNRAITYGGGIQQMGGVLTAVNVSLFANSAEQGGGLYVEGATSVLTNVRVVSNRATGDGGGLAARGGSHLYVDADFSDCNPFSLPARYYCSEVSFNEAAGQGAGVYVEDSQAFIGHTAFLSNAGDFSYSHGGALMVGTSAQVTATDTLFTGHGQSGESAVHVYNQATYHSENSTYAGNSDIPLFVVSQGTADLNRNIIWENGAAHNLQGAISSQCNDTESGLSGGFANFSEDPRFVETSRGLYRLGAGSPAIDACAPGISERGLDGRRRGIMIKPGQTLINYDVGAFEFPQRVYLPLVLRNP